jgi:tetratricopeptide (TPR) repeat protein
MPSRFPPLEPPPPPPPPPSSGWLRIAGAVVLLLAGGAVVAYFALRTDKRADALIACKTGRFNEVEKVLNELLARHPDDLEVRECLALGYASTERPAEAEPHLTKLLEAKPQDQVYLKRRMEQYHKLKRQEDEYADARRLLELDPDDKLRRRVMELAFGIARLDEAEDLCRAMLRDEPKDRGLRLMMARIRRAQGDDKGSGEILDQLIREDPKNYGALLARGILFYETGRSDQAVPLLWRVYHEDRDRKRTSGYQLSVALHRIGQEEEARKILEEVRRMAEVALVEDNIKGQPDDLDLQVRMAESLIKDGHTDDGLQLLNLVLRRDPKFARAHLALAAHYEKEGKPDLAARHRKLADGSQR